MSGALSIQDAFAVGRRCVYLRLTPGEASSGTRVVEIMCTGACPVKSAPLERLLYAGGIVGAH